MRDAWVEWRWPIAAALVLVFILVFWRDSISERLLPDPRMNRQLERAQLALAHGQLSAANGGGARELFESVLATDPDQMTARQGLIDVRNAAIARAQHALDRHRLFQARRYLALAADLSAPAVQMQPLRARLRDLEQATSDVPALLAQASKPGVDDVQALALFNRVLQLDADNQAALEGRSVLLAGWLGKAEALLAAKRVHAAQALVERVIANDPAHLDLPPVQAELGDALAREQREQGRILELAQADERAGRIDHAAEAYLRLVAAGNDSASVSEALHRLAVQMTLQAQRQAADFEFRRAEASLAKARRWSPGAAEITIAEQRLAQSRLTRKRFVRAPVTSDEDRLPGLLADAEQAMGRGDFITPPGTSAWDKLRVASAIAPEAPQVVKAQREFGQRSRACFEQALSGGQLRRAQVCLEASLSLEPASAHADEARRRMAERWLAYADERIGASDYVEAEQALVFARRWQPSSPQLKAMEARLRRASRGSR